MVCNNLGCNSLIKPKCYENELIATVLTILISLDSRKKEK